MFSDALKADYNAAAAGAAGVNFTCSFCAQWTSVGSAIEARWQREVEWWELCKSYLNSLIKSYSGLIWIHAGLKPWQKALSQTTAGMRITHLLTFSLQLFHRYEGDLNCWPCRHNPAYPTCKCVARRQKHFFSKTLLKMYRTWCVFSLLSRTISILYVLGPICKSDNWRFSSPTRQKPLGLHPKASVTDKFGMWSSILHD